MSDLRVPTTYQFMSLLNEIKDAIENLEYRNEYAPIGFLDSIMFQAKLDQHIMANRYHLLQSLAIDLEDWAEQIECLESEDDNDQ